MALNNKLNTSVTQLQYSRVKLINTNECNTTHDTGEMLHQHNIGSTALSVQSRAELASVTKTGTTGMHKQY